VAITSAPVPTKISFFARVVGACPLKAPITGSVFLSVVTVGKANEELLSPVIFSTPPSVEHAETIIRMVRVDKSFLKVFVCILITGKSIK
jgi:hypothetical protein